MSRGCLKSVIFNHVGSQGCHCEERSDAAISYRGYNYRFEIATVAKATSRWRGTYETTSPHLPLLFCPVKTPYAIINTQSMVFHKLALLMDNYTGDINMPVSKKRLIANRRNATKQAFTCIFRTAVRQNHYKTDITKSKIWQNKPISPYPHDRYQDTPVFNIWNCG